MSASSARNAPSTLEIVLGSILSVILGVFLASVFLACRPMKVVNEIPKEPEEGVVYFLEGSKDYEASRRWAFKHDVFVKGQSVQVTEGELNFWGTSVYPPVPKDKPSDATFSFGTPQFHIQDDELKIGTLCTFNFFGLFRHQFPVQVAGGFVKNGDHYAFKPREVVVGALPAQRLGPIGTLIYRQVVNAFVPPEDVAAAWNKLTDVHVEGNELILASS